MTFNDAKTKYRSPYLLDPSQPYFQNRLRTSLGRPWDVSEGRRQNTSLGVTGQTIQGHCCNVCRKRPLDVGKGRPLALHIGHYWDDLRTLYWDVLRASYFNVHRATQRTFWERISPFGEVLRTSLGRNFAQWEGTPCSKQARNLKLK